jgi:hypothetical protein
MWWISAQSISSFQVTWGRVGQWPFAARLYALSASVMAAPWIGPLGPATWAAAFKATTALHAK